MLLNFPSKIFGIGAGKLFGVTAMAMATGTAEAALHPSPLQSWAVIAGAVATTVTSMAAILTAKQQHSRGNRRRKPGAITRRKQKQKP